MFKSRISKALFKYVYLVGETKVRMNQSLFYIYDNCTVEKKLIL